MPPRRTTPTKHKVFWWKKWPWVNLFCGTVQCHLSSHCLPCNIDKRVNYCYSVNRARWLFWRLRSLQAGLSGLYFISKMYLLMQHLVKFHFGETLFQLLKLFTFFLFWYTPSLCLVYCIFLQKTLLRCQWQMTANIHIYFPDYENQVFNLRCFLYCTRHNLRAISNKRHVRSSPPLGCSVWMIIFSLHDPVNLLGGDTVK